MAAPSNPEYAAPIPIKGQPLVVYGWIKDSTTGNPITSIGTLSATISKDGGTGVATTNTPQAVTSHNGRFYLVLTAAETAYYNVGITVTSSTANQISATIDITFADASEKTGHWRAQTTLKLEDAILAINQYIQNKAKQSNADPHTITVRNYGDTATLWSFTDTNDGTYEVKGVAT